MGGRLDPCVLRLFAEMFEDSRGLADGREIAAFLERDAAGHFALTRWASDALLLRETFRGRVPPRTVAIVHTHPIRWSRPSDEDVRASVALGLPNYVLSRTIQAVDPSTGLTVEVAGPGWYASARRLTCVPSAPFTDPATARGSGEGLKAD